MQTIRQFFSWFSKQKLIGQLAIGCSSLFILCLLCSVPLAVLSPSTPTPEANNTGVAEVVPSTINTPAEKPTDLPTLTPISTLALAPATIVVPTLPIGTNISGANLPAPENSLRFYFFNVGQGDATLLQMPDGKTLLIDGGEPDTGIVSDLQSLGIQRIDLMIATHPHSDHIGGLVQVLQSFPVTEVVTNGQPETTSVFEHFLDGIAAAKAEYVEVKRGDVISLGGIDFRVLNPANTDNPDLNENSVVLQFKYGQTTFLMMGDSGADTEAALMSAGLPLKAAILNVGHHGSTTGSTPAFLNAVQPKIALYSAGINNQYGLPSAKTIAALQAAGATVYGTDQNGTIGINVNLNGYTINTAQNTAMATPVLPPAAAATNAPSAPGALEILSVTSPVSKGANATLTAQTSPNASCTITVYYKSGASSAAGLVPKAADASGRVFWTWKVGSRTTSGTWRIAVTCNGVTKETTHTVQ